MLALRLLETDKLIVLAHRQILRTAIVRAAMVVVMSDSVSIKPLSLLVFRRTIVFGKNIPGVNHSGV